MMLIFYVSNLKAAKAFRKLVLFHTLIKADVAV